MENMWQGFSPTTLLEYIFIFSCEKKQSKSDLGLLFSIKKLF